MNNRILTATARLRVASIKHREALEERIEQMRANPEEGSVFEDLPWKGILLVGGITIGTLVVGGLTAYATGLIGKLGG